MQDSPSRCVAGSVRRHHSGHVRITHKRDRPRVRIGEIESEPTRVWRVTLGNRAAGGYVELAAVEGKGISRARTPAVGLWRGVRAGRILRHPRAVGLIEENVAGRIDYDLRRDPNAVQRPGGRNVIAPDSERREHRDTGIWGACTSSARPGADVDYRSHQRLDFR